MILAEAIDTTRIHRVAGRTGARTALIVTNLGRAPPHDLVAAASLNGGGLVNTVTQRSRQQACYLLPVHGQAADVFYKQRHEPPLRLGEGGLGLFIPLILLGMRVAAPDETRADARLPLIVFPVVKLVV